MSSGAQAYARTAELVTTPRDIEAQALLKAMQKLQKAQANWSESPKELRDALLFNRKLWSIFLAEALNDNSATPIEFRQQIANLGAFVMKQTLDIQFNEEPGKLEALININRQLAAGLRGQG